MSKQGIKLAAQIYSAAQEARQQLLHLGSEGKKASTPAGKQDILLAQLLGKMNDATKDEFCKITEMI